MSRHTTRSGRWSERSNVRSRPALPGVEVLAVELAGPERFTVYVDHPRGRRPRALRARDRRARATTCASTDRRLVARDRAAAAQAGALRERGRPDRSRSARPDRGRKRLLAARSSAPASAPSPFAPASADDRDPVRRDRAGQPDRRVEMSRGAMTQEIIEAVRTIEREKGIESGTLVTRARGRAARRVQEDAGRVPPRRRRARRRGRLPRVLDRDAGRPRGAAARRGARGALEELERLEEETGERQHTLLNDDDLELDWVAGPRGADRARGRHPENFGRIAAQTAKQVIQQRIREAERAMMYDEYIDRVRRGRHRDRPAGRRPQQRARRPRQGRGAAAALGAGRRRALRAGLADQGRDHRGPLGHEGPAGDPLAPRSGADQDAVRARGARRSPTASSRSAASPASRATARRSRSSRTPRASTRSAPASARAARACAWSSPSCAARRSTSSRGTPSRRASSRRRSRRRACARSTSTTRPRRRPSSSRTTSSRSRSARRA